MTRQEKGDLLIQVIA